MNPLGVLFVCSSNLCRSPLAEAVFRRRARDARLPGIDAGSAGTHGGRSGERPDARACAVAARRGYLVPAGRARRVGRQDFARFGWMLAMDARNLADLARQVPAGYRGEIALLLDLVPGAAGGEVDDPYYGPLAGFERVLDLCEAASDALLAVFAQRGR